MKIYFSYTENGEFDGFYNNEIHSEIPNRSVEITEKLWDSMRQGIFKIKIYKLNKINKTLDLEDKETYFEELKEEINTNENENYIVSLTKEIAKNKVAMMQKDSIINVLIREQAKNRIEKMKGSN